MLEQLVRSSQANHLAFRIYEPVVCSLRLVAQAGLGPLTVRELVPMIDPSSISSAAYRDDAIKVMRSSDTALA